MPAALAGTLARFTQPRRMIVVDEPRDAVAKVQTAVLHVLFGS